MMMMIITNINCILAVCQDWITEASSQHPGEEGAGIMRVISWDSGNLLIFPRPHG